MDEPAPSADLAELCFLINEFNDVEAAKEEELRAAEAEERRRRRLRAAEEARRNPPAKSSPESTTPTSPTPTLTPKKKVDVAFKAHLETPSRLAISISNLIHQIPITCFVEANSRNPEAFESHVVREWNEFTQGERDEALHRILKVLRKSYAEFPPPFGTCPYIRTGSSGDLETVERLDPRHLRHLKSPDEVLDGQTPEELGLKLVETTALTACAFDKTYPRSSNSQVQLVKLLEEPGKMYIAKGPSSISEFAELRELLSLRHKHVCKPPTSLVVFDSSHGQVVVGFLLEYNPLGNLDMYAAGIGKMIPQRIWAWGRQIVDTVHWLHRERETFHGDVKPDNLIVANKTEEGEELRFVNFAQDTITAATCAPELREEWGVNEVDGKLVYSEDVRSLEGHTGARLIRDLPVQAREKAEVYAVGRTIYLLAKSVEMSSIYMDLYDEADHEYKVEWDETEMRGECGERIRQFVVGCTKRNPLERISLDEMKRTFATSYPMPRPLPKKPRISSSIASPSIRGAPSINSSVAVTSAATSITTIEPVARSVSAMGLEPGRSSSAMGFERNRSASAMGFERSATAMGFESTMTTPTASMLDLSIMPTTSKPGTPLSRNYSRRKSGHVHVFGETTVTDNSESVETPRKAKRGRRKSLMLNFRKMFGGGH